MLPPFTALPSWLGDEWAVASKRTRGWGDLAVCCPPHQQCWPSDMTLGIRGGVDWLPTPPPRCPSDGGEGGLGGAIDVEGA